MIATLSRRAFSGRAGDLARTIADVQLEAVREDFGVFVRLENRYHSEPKVRRRLDRQAPEIARSIRNGRLAAAFYERLAVWQLEAGILE